MYKNQYNKKEVVPQNYFFKSKNNKPSRQLYSQLEPNSAQISFRWNVETLNEAASFNFTQQTKLLEAHAVARSEVKAVEAAAVAVAVVALSF